MKFYGQWNPPVDKLLYDNYFKDKSGGFFIECGANDGIAESCCKFFEESMEWKGINIEPVPHSFNKLVKNRPNSVNLQLALSNNEGVFTFTQAIHPTYGQDCNNGSLCHTDEHKKILVNMGCKFVDIDVQTITYKQLIATQNISKVDLFVLDVEGHESQVLEGMIGCDVMPTVICVEYNRNTDKIDNMITTLGYKLDKISFVNAFLLYS